MSDFTSKEREWNLKFISKEPQLIFVTKKCHRTNFKLFFANLTENSARLKKKYIFDLKKIKFVFFHNVFASTKHPIFVLTLRKHEKLSILLNCKKNILILCLFPTKMFIFLVKKSSKLFIFKVIS